MPPEELTIEERILELEEKITRLSFQQLNNPLDSNTQSILTTFLKDNLFRVLFDTWWNDLYYYSSLVGENLDRYDGFGTQKGAISDSGLILATPATTGQSAGVQLRTTNVTNVLRFDREARFRVTVEKDNVANSTLIVRTLEDDDGHYAGFEIADAVIKGTVRDGSTESTVTLGTYTQDKKISLELHFLPTQQVNFLVREEDGDTATVRGTLDANLPQGGNSDKHIFQAKLTTDIDTELTAVIHQWEFMQKR